LSLFVFFEACSCDRLRAMQEGEGLSRPSPTVGPSPPEPLYEFKWVNDVTTLMQVAEEIDSASWIAIDTESNTQFAYQDQICLIQVGY